MNCIFCKITNNEMDSEIIYQNDVAVAILDIHPISPGHSMVIPRRHAQNILELEDENIKEVFVAVKEVTAILNSALSPDGFTIGINHGKASGQTVDHLHIHIVPRFDNDGGGSIHSIVDNSPSETLLEVAYKIKGKK